MPVELICPRCKSSRQAPPSAAKRGRLYCSRQCYLDDKQAKNVPIEVGKEYGWWTVLEETTIRSNNGQPRRIAVCRCRCGKVEKKLVYVLLGDLYNRCIICHNKAKASYGDRAEYSVWKGMITRCTNPRTEGFENYGGRGIKVCERWRNDFWAFLSDMGDRPSSDHTIERRDVNGDYSPENCCWLPKEKQARNRRSNVRIAYQGRTQTLIEWVEELGLSYQLMADRIRRRGWPAEEAFTTPKLTDAERIQRVIAARKECAKKTHRREST